MASTWPALLEVQGNRPGPNAVNQIAIPYQSMPGVDSHARSFLSRDIRRKSKMKGCRLRQRHGLNQKNLIAVSELIWMMSLHLEHRPSGRTGYPIKEEKMTRTLKVLGVAAFAVCAFAAVSVSSASAVDVLTCASSPCYVTGEQVGTGAQNFFGVKGSTLETRCANTAPGTTFGPSTITSGASKIKIKPVYAGCTTEPLGPSPVDNTGCEFELTGETDATTDTNGVAQTDATVSLRCEAGKHIEITGPNCTITFNETGNVGLKGVTYDNVAGSPDDVLVTATVDNITYTASGSLCDFANVKTPGGNNGILTERITAKAFVHGGSSEGAQTGLTQS